jgi:uncharacterized membrane protein
VEEPRERSPEERIEALERAVEEIQATLRVGARTAPPERGVAAEPTRPAPVPAPRPAPQPRRWLPADLVEGDPWRWIGIALLLFGVAFLFKYSIDRGWLTPQVRVGFGFLLASALLAISGRLPAARRAFGRILDGGAVATLYITGFAAFQLYALVPYGVAFGFLVGVTLLAFWLSWRQDDAVLALIGAVGGLGTPFLLARDEASIPGLVAYTALVLAGTSAVYLKRGWRSLLFVSAVGGWLVLGVALLEAGPPFPDGPSQDRVALQLGILFASLCFWGAPLWRALGRASGAAEPSTPGTARAEAMLFAVSTPLVALTLSSALHDYTRETWGWTALVAAFAFAGIAARLSREAQDRESAAAQALASLVLLTLALALLLEGNWLLVSLAAEGLALHILALRVRDPVSAFVGHALFAFVASEVLRRLAESGLTPHLWNGQALSDLFVIGAAVVAASRMTAGADKTIYRVVAHAAFLLWLARELAGFANGQGLVTVAWGVYALALLILGLRRDDGALRMGGRLTLFLVVAKLFLVDLREVETLWRIVSFLGFGVVFLALSYWLRDLWKPGAANEAKDGA